MATVSNSKTAKQSDSAKAAGLHTIFEDAGVYINPLTDFGFKRLFGTEANRDLLMDFLNAVLDIDGGIKDLQFRNTEKQGRVKTDPKVVFDLHCITGKDERIIIEMQKLPQEYYRDRALYYASFPIQEQGEKRKNRKKWNYMLYPVYSVNIVNFKLNKTRKAQKYTSYIQLMDRDTCEVFYDKLTFVYLELPRFNKKDDELDTGVEHWMYVLKHLSNLNDLPATLHSRIFKKLFEQAKIANMSKEEMNDYQQSLKNYRDMYLIEDEWKKKLATERKALAAKDKRLAAKDKIIEERNKALQKALARIAELERKFGIN